MMSGAASGGRQTDPRSEEDRESGSTGDSLVAALREVHAQSKMVGWDFSRLDGRLISDDPWWDFEVDCRSAMSRAERILDLGTGGGERLLGLLDQIDTHGKSIVATEGWEPNVGVARDALSACGVDVVWYDVERGERMPFPDGHFDLVMSRHEAIDASEVARVLSPGGRFLTQQVDGHDSEEIHEWFDEPFVYPQVTSRQYVEDLAAAGLSIEVADDWQGRMEFTDVEALVTYLALVPWDAPTFTVDAHAERLVALAKNPPIDVTQRRFRVYATKPGESRT